MRSSEEKQMQQAPSRRPAWKILIWFVIAAAVFFAVVLVLDTALYPCTYLRNDIHKISTEPVDVLILGTSNAKMGIDPEALLSGTGLTGHNLAAGSEYPVDSYYITRLAASVSKPKTIIYDVDPGYFTTEKEKGNNYVLFYHEFPLSPVKAEFAAAILHDSDIRPLFFPFYEYPLKTTIPRIGENIRKKLGRDYSRDSLKNNIQEYHENGFIEKYPVKEEKFPDYSMEEFSAELVLDDNIEYLGKLIDFCDRNGIEFIATAMPLPDKTIEDNRQSLETVWEYFGNYFEEKGISFYNFNTDRYKQYSHLAVHYVDYDGHLNGDSAREFSGIFGQILQHR